MSHGIWHWVFVSLLLVISFLTFFYWSHQFLKINQKKKVTLCKYCVSGPYSGNKFTINCLQEKLRFVSRIMRITYFSTGACVSHSRKGSGLESPDFGVCASQLLDNSCLSLTYSTQHYTLQNHPCCRKWQNFIHFQG